MEKEFAYPGVEEIVEANVFVLGLMWAKKADKHEVLSRQKISAAIEACREKQGDLCEKAAVLMRGIVSAHAFASGNRRTAFLVTKQFVVNNGGKFLVPNDTAYAKVLQGVREGKYSVERVAEWIRSGKI